MSSNSSPNWVSDLVDLVGPARVVTDPDRLVRFDRDQWPLAIKAAAIGEPLGHPEAVVIPGDASQVAALLAYATRSGVPVTAWGLGSSVVGGPLAEHGGIVCDLTDLAGVLDFSQQDLWVRARAGTPGTDLEAELDSVGLTLGHSPQSLGQSTVGGWIATRATGQFSSHYGGIEDMLLGLELALPTGELVRTPLSPRFAFGPDFAGLVVGSEGTLGIVTEATLKVARKAPHRRLAALAFPAVGPLIAAMRDVAQGTTRPYLVRGYDHAETAHLANGEIDGCLLLLGCEGEEAVCEAAFHECLTLATGHGGTELGPEPVERWLERRFDFSVVESLLAREGGYAETIEVASFWSGAVDLHAHLTGALAEHADDVWGHFSHVYPQGTSLYLIVRGQVAGDRAAIDRLRRIWQTAMEVCLQHGGVIAHHHGVGIARRAWMSEGLGDLVKPMQAIKRALDPMGIANPGKLSL